jgi:4'-phosphopantetheinyl transferase
LNISDCIHIWYFHLDRDGDERSKFDRYLSDGERQRVSKLVNIGLQQKQIIIRGAVRSILSKYLAIPPQEIEFAAATNGKPYLLYSSLRFNLSHSHNLGTLAICYGASLGIDIEYCRPLDSEKLVDRFFAPSEKIAFHRLPEIDRPASFFHAWTQKEAYLKAIGTGLATPLDRIIVNLNPHSLPQLLNGDPAWQIYPLDRLPANYRGAIVVDRSRSTLEYYQI